MNYGIWDPGAVDFGDEQVTEEAALLERSIVKYSLDVRDIWLIQAKEKATVWRLETPKGAKAFKWIGSRGDKAIFSVFAHHHMETIGFPVPRISPTVDGAIYLVHDERVGFMADWVEGRSVNLDINEDWNLFLDTLGEFHERSIGYQAPDGVRVKSKLGAWPLTYQASISWMRLWYQEAAARNGSYFQLYRKLIPSVIDQASRVLDQLTGSTYWNWVERARQRPGLCHGDFGESNTILSPQGELYVIDMDTVTHDLPLRDLRKIFESFLDPAVDLSSALERIVESYTQHTPLTDEQVQVFLIDVQFPYKVYKNAKRAFNENDLDEVGLAEEVEMDLARSRAVRGLHP